MVYKIKGSFWLEGISEPIFETVVFHSEEEVNRVIKNCCDEYLLSFGNLKIMMKKIIAYKFEEIN